MKINKEKELLILKLKSTFEESKNDLSQKVHNLNKVKNNFMNNMENTENLLNQYYLNKNQIPNENNDLANQKQITEEQINESINNSKKSEINYIFEKETGKSFEDTFTVISKCSVENIKQSILDIANNLKKSILQFILSLRNSFKVPVSEIEFYLPKVSTYEEDKILDEKIKNSLNKENNIKNKRIQNYNYFLKSIISKYDNLSLIQNENLKHQSLYTYNDKNVITLEDGLNETYFLNSEIVLMTAKRMKDTFKLVSIGEFDLKIEEEKIYTKTLTEKLLLSIPKNIKKNEINVNIDIKTINKKEINDLEKLLDKHYNRVIFFHKLDEYRTSGNFILPKKLYEIFGKFFNLCCDKIKIDNDLQTGKSSIILSQTYYTIENNKKEYIQYLISNNKIFEDINFWKQLLEMELNKEIKKNSKYISKEKINNLNDLDVIEKDNYRFSNIAFAQIVTILDNMIEFGLNINKVNEVIEPKIEYFKLDESLRQNIKEMIDSKLNSKKVEENNKISETNINTNEENNNQINEINDID